jgi:hypothetical protein
MTYRVIHTAPYYASPGESNRGDIPAGSTVEIVGTSGEWSQISGQDPNPWRGKWLRTFYLEEVVEGEEPEPEPEPEPQPEPAPYFILEEPSGARTRYLLAPVGFQANALQRFVNFFKGVFRA